MDEVADLDRSHVVPDLVDEQFLRGLVAQLDPAVALAPVIDATGAIVDLRFVELNDRARAFFARPRDELLSGTLLGMFPRHRVSGFFEQLVDVLSTGSPLELDDAEFKSAVRPSGTLFDIRASRVARVVVASWRDNTARVAAHRALAESEERYRLLAENSSDAVALSDGDGMITWASPSLTANFGWSSQEIVGRHFTELLHPDDIADNTDKLEQVRRGHGATIRARLRTGNGDYRWVSSRVTPILDDHGDVVRRVAAWRDVHEEQMALLALTQAREQLTMLVDNSSDAVATGDNSGTMTWVSGSARSLTGWEPAQLTGRPFIQFVHPDDRELVRAAQTRVLAATSVTFEVRFRLASGDYRWLSFQVRPQLNTAGEVTGRIAGWRDVHVEHIGREAIRSSEERFRAAMQSAPIGMAVVDLERRFLSVNPALCELLGRSDQWLLSHSLTDVFDPLDDGSDRAMRDELLRTGGASASGERRMVHNDGRIVWVQHIIAVVHGERSEPIGFVSQCLDITDTIRNRRNLEHQATHDTLTQVGNREELQLRLSELMARPSAATSAMGVLFIDVDQLKQINDAHGHHVGDDALVDIAHCILSCTRAHDIVVRYGGDEFVVVLPDVESLSSVHVIAEKIRAAVEHLREPTGSAIPLTVSIGLAFAQQRERLDTALARADEALYLAKHRGRNQVAGGDAVGDS